MCDRNFVNGYGGGNEEGRFLKAKRALYCFFQTLGGYMLLEKFLRLAYQAEATAFKNTGKVVSYKKKGCI